jgi:glycosyltransferase involved in cell wall biosynthesis
MLAQSFSPIVGGVERAVEDLSEELLRAGHDVAIATLRQPGVERTPDSNGIRVHALRTSSARIPGGDRERHHAPPVPDPETLIDLRRVLRDERPEVVHAHDWLLHSYLPLDRRAAAALVVSLHDYGLLCATKRLFRDGVECSGPGPVKCVVCAGGYYGLATGLPIALGTRLRVRTVHRHVDMFLPVSTAVAELSGLGADDRYRIVPNFIGELPPPPADDDPRLAELPAEPFILYFGDARKDKGVPQLLEAYSTLERPPPLVLIGRWMLDRRLEVPGVSAFGPWPRELVIEAARRSLFTVAPSIWPEPFGLVALEAAAAGKPVVAARSGGLKDLVVDGETGLLVPAGDTTALRTAMQRLIGDEEERRTMGEAAARRAAQFSPEAVVPEFELAYRAAVEARESRRERRH